MQHIYVLATSSSTKQNYQQSFFPNFSEEKSAPLGPFLKWAGGKRQLLSILLHRSPSLKKGRYHEPFLGGGALFFALQMHKRLGSKKARLADINEELITTYLVVRDHVHELIKRLKTYRNDVDFFYELRSIHPNTLSPVERAARMIYLNKTCFNGLFRENQQGFFNVPYGKYSNPKICDESNLLSAHHGLLDVCIENSSFEEIIEVTKPGDFVYFDPPYVPLNKTSCFVQYHAGGFQNEDHTKLAKLVKELADRSVNVMVSNSSAPLVYELYASWPKEAVSAKRSISGKTEMRGRVQELLIYAGPYAKELWHLRDSNPEPYTYEASALAG